jgi:hypothetical protein
MELLVSLIYRTVSGEHLWLARLLASAFWLVGGVFLFKVAERIVSFEAAIFSTAYYLFVPLGVMASRSFQPDSLMILIFLFGLFAIVRHYDQPSTFRLVMAASISGFAILVKPLVLFALLGAFCLVAISRRATTPPSWGDSNVNENGGRGDIGRLSHHDEAPRNGVFIAARSLKWVIDGQILIFIVVSLSPTALYYGYGISIIDSLESQAQGSFLPQLLLSPEYWKQWLLTAAGAVGSTALIAGLLGLPMLRKGVSRALLIGLWIGYAVFCMVFTNHVRFASYYHLQLVIIVALSFGPIITLILNHLRQLSNRWYWWLPVIGALLLVTLLDIRDIRLRHRLAAYRNLESVETAQEIGEIVGHSTQNVYLASHYGMPLEYYGELSGEYWPRRISDRDRALGRWGERGLTVEERFQALDFVPEYFIITHFNELNRHHADLKEYLSNNCPLVAESDQYLIYGACTKQF